MLFSVELTKTSTTKKPLFRIISPVKNTKLLLMDIAKFILHKEAVIKDEKKPLCKYSCQKMGRHLRKRVIYILLVRQKWASNIWRSQDLNVNPWQKTKPPNIRIRVYCLNKQHSFLTFCFLRSWPFEEKRDAFVKMTAAFPTSWYLDHFQ